ncbi:MAG: hypothetical protein P8Y97_14590 [Candidatus Lokiarchaeota archaeon]
MEIQNQINPDPIKPSQIQEPNKKEIDDDIVGIMKSVNLIAEIFCRFYEDEESCKESSKTRKD